MLFVRDIVFIIKSYSLKRARARSEKYVDNFLYSFEFKQWVRMRLPDYDVIETVKKFSGSKRRLEVMWNDTSRNDEEPFRVRLYRQELRILHPSLRYRKTKNPLGRSRSTSGSRVITPGRTSRMTRPVEPRTTL